MSSVTFQDLFETGWFFGARALQGSKRHPLMIHWTGFLASVLTIFYCVYELCYYYVNMASRDAHCAVFKVWIVMRTASNALAFLHLFLRADAVNAINPNWPPWRRFGIALLVATLIMLIAVAATRSARLVRNPPFGERCEQSYEPVSFALKWVVQLLCHITFSLMFIYPLVDHMRAVRAAGLAVAHTPRSFLRRVLRRTVQKPSVTATENARAREDSNTAPVTGSMRGDTVYQRLVRRAVISLVASSLFTIAVAVMVFLDIFGAVSDMPLVAFAILDNGFTLGAIYFANSGGLTPQQAPTLAVPPEAPKCVGASSSAHSDTSSATPHASLKAMEEGTAAPRAPPPYSQRGPWDRVPPPIDERWAVGDTTSGSQEQASMPQV
ncbi:hypothetical protein JKP88DRAFT_301140 [Tribonema minus]|uniref:Transmembrane protein n=1 Tax=Tribonema minus TaxID=303371 RepID=A0A835ZIT3_9STRA|nr:hypothetical protein JKP88DRAFT_301140 [Tribonema minus]